MTLVIIPSTIKQCLSYVVKNKEQSFLVKNTHMLYIKKDQKKTHSPIYLRWEEFFSPIYCFFFLSNLPFVVTVRMVI